MLYEKAKLQGGEFEGGEKGGASDRFQGLLWEGVRSHQDSIFDHIMHPFFDLNADTQNGADMVPNGGQNGAPNHKN